MTDYFASSGNQYYVRPGGDPTATPNDPGIFLGSSDIYDVFNNYVRTIERAVKAIYPEQKLECPNCYLDSLGTGIRSISKYKAGGPSPFVDGQPCSYCGGRGYVVDEVSDIIPSRIYNNPKSWINKSVALRLPANSLMLLTRLEFSAQIKQAKYIVPYYNDLNSLQLDVYERSHELSSDSWVQNGQKYITSYWSQRNETQ